MRTEEINPVDVDEAGRKVTERALTWPARAKALVISNADTYVAAAEELKGIKALLDEVDRTFDSHIARAHEAHKALITEKRKASTPLQEAEGIIKRGLVAYNQEQERIARVEAQRLQAEERKREEERRLAEAVALEAESKATGDATLMEEAVALIEQPAPPPPMVIVQKTTPKISGITHTYKPWRAYVTDLLKLAAYVVAHPAEVNLILPNLVALNQLAKARDGKINVDGVAATREPNLNASGR